MTTHSLDIAELLDQWNNHSTPEWTSTVPTLFAAQCEATPDAVAVVILPELIFRGWRRLLHNQRALYIKRLLLFEPRVILAAVPYRLN